MKGDIHVLPLNDLKPHTEKEDCACKPEIKYEEGNRIIVHNSYDGREFFEELGANRERHIH